MNVRGVNPNRVRSELDVRDDDKAAVRQRQQRQIPGQHYDPGVYADQHNTAFFARAAENPLGTRH